MNDYEKINTSVGELCGLLNTKTGKAESRRQRGGRQELRGLSLRQANARLTLCRPAPCPAVSPFQTKKQIESRFYIGTED